MASTHRSSQPLKPRESARVKLLGQVGTGNKDTVPAGSFPAPKIYIDGLSYEKKVRNSEGGKKSRGDGG